MSDHRARGEFHSEAACTMRNGDADRQIDATLAVYHATLALVEAADAQVAATKAQTAAMERLGKVPRDTSTRAPGLGW